MSKKEEKARQYSNQKIKEKDLYPFYSANTKRRLTTFDAYELEDAVEFGWDAATKEVVNQLKLTLSLMSSVPPYIQNHIIDLVEYNIKKE